MPSVESRESERLSPSFDSAELPRGTRSVLGRAAGELPSFAKPCAVSRNSVETFSMIRHSNFTLAQMGPRKGEKMKKELYYGGLQPGDMAEWLGVYLFGHTPDGELRISRNGEPQPTEVMAYDSLKAEFLARFRVVPDRPHGNLFRVEQIED